MTKEIKIAVDTGGANTKFSYVKNNEIEAGLFPTVIQEIKETDTLAEGIKVEYKGEHYLFPKHGIPLLTKVNTKLDHIHIKSAYVAIAKALSHLEVDTKESHAIDLSINVPIVEFKNREVKESYMKQYLNKNINIIVDGVEYTFAIIKVRPFFESQGCLLRNIESYQKGNVLVIDLGGRNESVCLFKNLIPQAGISFSGTLGSLKTLEKIANQLSQNGETFTIEDVQEFQTGVQPLKPEDFQEIFDKEVRMLLHKLSNKLVGYDINYSLTKVIFTGGGAILFKENIKEYFFKTMKHLHINSTDGWADNCKGALRRALNSED